MLFARSGPIAKCAREAVTSADIARLRPGQWLNDEIINFYGAMILERATKAKGAVKVHYFSTFFWPKLNEGYEKSKLNRWTKKVRALRCAAATVLTRSCAQIDIFAKDVILVPVNHGNAHWTAAAVNFRRKRIESYDSMGMRRTNVLMVCTFVIPRAKQTLITRRCSGNTWSKNTKTSARSRSTSRGGQTTSRTCVLHLLLRPRTRLIYVATGYTTAGKLLRLRCVHMPVLGDAVAGRGGICVPAEGHALSAAEDGMGNRARELGRAELSRLIDWDQVLWCCNRNRPSLRRRA